MVHILRHAQGRYGTTLQYLAETAAALHERGVRDREIERLMALARQQGLLAARPLLSPGPDSISDPAAPA
jgi:cation transport protein ChaC